MNDEVKIASETAGDPISGGAFVNIITGELLRHPSSSLASAGSHWEPVAWAIQWNGSDAPDLEWVFPKRRDVDLELLEAPSKGVAVPLYSQPQPTLTDEERDDITIWLAECLRQCSATTGLENGDVAERWRNRALRAGRMLTRFN